MNDEVTITVKMSNLVKLKEDAETLVFNPNAEQSLLQLLELQARVADVIGQVKHNIIEQGLAYNPNFTSVAGNNVKANYSAAGAKYAINKDELQRYRPPYFVTKVTHMIDSKLVEKYEAKHHGKLPKGIVKPSRNKNLTFRVK